jgi:hypothetical protein
LSRGWSFRVALAAAVGVAPWLAGRDAAAQAPRAAPSAIVLTRERAIEMARERAPEVRLAVHRVREAEATRVGAGLVMPANPRLAVEARPSILKSEYPSRQLGYSAVLDTLFEVGGAPSARVREAGLRARSSQLEAEVVRFHAGLDAWRAWVAGSAAEQRIADLVGSALAALVRGAGAPGVARAARARGAPLPDPAARALVERARARRC